MTSPPGTPTSNLLPLEDPAAGGREADPTSPLGPPSGGPGPAAASRRSRGRATASRPA